MAAVKQFLFSDREWAGFRWLLKVLSVCCGAAVIVTLLYEYSPARPHLAPLLPAGDYPVYVLIFGVLLGVPAFNLCRAALLRFPTKSRGLPALLAILALYCASVIIAQLALSRLLPVFTSALAALFLCLAVLSGCWYILKRIAGELRRGS